jgi:hypothetical protein
VGELVFVGLADTVDVVDAVWLLVGEGDGVLVIVGTGLGVRVGVLVDDATGGNPVS